MIKGIGTDIIEKRRIAKVYIKYGDRFLRRVLSRKELNEFNIKKTEQKRISYLSNNFVAKESISKAMGTGLSAGLSFKKIEIIRDKYGAPKAKLLGNFTKEKLGISVSISDSKSLSIGFAVIEG